MKYRITLGVLTAISAVSMANAHITESKDTEKCFGVSAVGQNDCANLAGTHACAGQATLANDIGEWRLVPASTCKELGGYSQEQAMKMFEKLQRKERNENE